ncbi:hypothetical protein QUW49_08885 [Lacrimispora saccharolytica]|nr:hypothetical protein [Lacrimispora saccharolytica]
MFPFTVILPASKSAYKKLFISWNSRKKQTIAATFFFAFFLLFLAILEIYLFQLLMDLHTPFPALILLSFPFLAVLVFSLILIIRISHLHFRQFWNTVTYLSDLENSIHKICFSETSLFLDVTLFGSPYQVTYAYSKFKKISCFSEGIVFYLQKELPPLLVPASAFGSEENFAKIADKFKNISY